MHREELQGALEEWNDMWPKDEPRQDRSDVGWETERGAKHQVGMERHYASEELCILVEIYLRTGMWM